MSDISCSNASLYFPSSAFQSASRAFMNQKTKYAVELSSEVIRHEISLGSRSYLDNWITPWKISPSLYNSRIMTLWHSCLTHVGFRLPELTHFSKIRFFFNVNPGSGHLLSRNQLKKSEGSDSICIHLKQENWRAQLKLTQGSKKNRTYAIPSACCRWKSTPPSKSSSLMSLVLLGLLIRTGTDTVSSKPKLIELQQTEYDQYVYHMP